MLLVYMQYTIDIYIYTYVYDVYVLDIVLLLLLDKNIDNTVDYTTLFYWDYEKIYNFYGSSLTNHRSIGSCLLRYVPVNAEARGYIGRGRPNTKTLDNLKVSQLA